MSRPLRVLQVISALGMGGGETWLMELLRRWSRTGEVEMDFLLTGGQDGVFDAEAKALGATLHRIPYSRNQSLTFLRDYRRLLAEGRYDAIHDHSDYAGGWKFLMGLGKLPPVRVAHVHNPWLHIEANYAVSPARRLTAAGGKRLVEILATDILGTSTPILQRYGFQPGAGRPRVRTVHCGFDLDRFNAPREEDRRSVLDEFRLPPDSRLVLFAGRIDRAVELDHPQNHKNSWLALNIVRAAQQQDGRIALIMAGDGGARAELQAHVQAWGLADRLFLVGMRQDMPRLMRAADILLFPSRQEGLGMAAVEAQAAGLPVLASTAVPSEAMVNPALFRALPLTAPIEAWAASLAELAAQERVTPAASRAAFLGSPFTIEGSAGALIEIYGRGR
ncbi:MAG: glycosyltransferase [Caulobacteraceae bacterium]|nr:glycosyltransferase [Caulobacteraceae bacterium]